MDALTRVRRKSSKSKTDEPASPVTAAASSGAKDQQHKDHGHNSTIAGTAEQLAAPPGGGGAAAATAGPVVSCAACGNPAFLKFACGGCKTERFYCQTYSCQFDDWSQHQTDCTALINSIYKEDTVITRLNDHSSWERRRRRSVRFASPYLAVLLFLCYSSLFFSPYCCVEGGIVVCPRLLERGTKLIACLFVFFSICSFLFLFVFLSNGILPIPFCPFFSFLTFLGPSSLALHVLSCHILFKIHLIIGRH